MSNPETLNSTPPKTMSALPEAQFQGFAEVREAGLHGMITLRGDLASKEVAKAVKAATGLKLPKPRQIVQGDGGAVAWMSPDELLVMVPYPEVDAALAVLDKTLNGQHYMAVNVSDARAVFDVTGAGAREVIAKLAPIDMAAFTGGEIRRSRLAQVAAAFWLINKDTGDETVRVVCFRSVAQYAFDVLKTAAEPGSEVGFID